MNFQSQMQLLKQIKAGQVYGKMMAGFIFFLILSFFIILSFSGCEKVIKQGAQHQYSEEKKIWVNNNFNPFGIRYYELEIEGCEYILTKGADNCLTHKGNCKNH